MSHDWPAGVTAWGDADRLVRCKPFFRDEVARGALGSAPGGVLLAALRPRYWFAGHLHVKFTALVPHPPAVGDKGGVYGGAGGGGGGSGDGDGGAGATPAAGTGTPAAPPSPLTTRFLALDKVLPNRDFLQLLDIPTEGGASPPSFAPTPATATAADAAGDGAPPPAPPPPVAPLTITRDPAWLAVLAAGRVAVPPSAVAAMVARLAAAGVPLAPPPPVVGGPPQGGGEGEERLGVAGPDGRVLLSAENARLATAAGIMLQGVAMPPLPGGAGEGAGGRGAPTAAAVAAPAAAAVAAPVEVPAPVSAAAMAPSDAAGAAAAAAAVATAVTAALADAPAEVHLRDNGKTAPRCAAMPSPPPPLGAPAGKLTPPPATAVVATVPPAEGGEVPPSVPVTAGVGGTPPAAVPMGVVSGAGTSAGDGDFGGGGGGGGVPPASAPAVASDAAAAAVADAAVTAAAPMAAAVSQAAGPRDDSHNGGVEPRPEVGGSEGSPEAKRQRTDAAMLPPT